MPASLPRSSPVHATPAAGLTRRGLLALPALALAAPALLPARPAAASLGAPSGRVVLDISGAISTRNSDATARFDLAMLDALPQHEFTTRTTWTDGPTRFSGPRLQTLLEIVGARGATLSAVALNDYAVTIPAADAARWPVLLATRQNGTLLPVREKGPLWIMYPFDADPELSAQLYLNRSIWQLRRIDVRA